MSKKNKIKIFAVLLLFCTAAFSLWAVGPALKKPASAEENGSWQGLLKKNGLNKALWEESLPGILHKEYEKIKEKLSAVLRKNGGASDSGYPLHQNISTTIFWIGEGESDANNDISNARSCWDDKWSNHFGGRDAPNKRNGYLPAGFEPKENPFYAALPYNDFNSKGNRKKEAASCIPWFGEKKWSDDESACKNRWIKIVKGEKTAYAQWEDAGPFGENDVNYVFGNAQPKSKENKHAGLDVSPAVRDYLELSDVDKTSWQFVDAKDVPDGPWKNIITKSNINWN